MPAQVVAAAAAHVAAVDVAGDGHRACSSCAGVLCHHRRWQGQQQDGQCDDESCQVFTMCFILRGGGAGSIGSWSLSGLCGHLAAHNSHRVDHHEGATIARPGGGGQARPKSDRSHVIAPPIIV